MKKILLIMALAIAVLTVSCGKERACRCVPKGGEYTDRTMVYTDNSMSCSSITRVGYERQLEGQLVRTMEEVECEDATNEGAE